jgi:hypothetical protein
MGGVKLPGCVMIFKACGAGYGRRRLYHFNAASDT